MFSAVSQNESSLWAASPAPSCAQDHQASRQHLPDETDGLIDGRRGANGTGFHPSGYSEDAGGGRQPGAVARPQAGVAAGLCLHCLLITNSSGDERAILGARQILPSLIGLKTQVSSGYRGQVADESAPGAQANFHTTALSIWKERKKGFCSESAP